MAKDLHVKAKLGAAVYGTKVHSVNGKAGHVVLTAEDVGALPSDTPIPSLDGYATEEWVQEQEYATEEDIPTNVSAFTNDAGYLTQHQDISEKADKTAVNALDDRVTALESGSGGGGGPTNMANGSADGSVRGINTASEDSSYTMGIYAFAEGLDTKASGDASHAEGSGTKATGVVSHAEGVSTQATGNVSHAEGYEAIASADSSHAEGSGTQASGDSSHAEGNGTIAQGHCQHVSGAYNIPQGIGTLHEGSDYVVIIGNGSDGARSNAFAMKWDGTFVFANGTEITPAQFASLLALLNSVNDEVTE